MHKNYPNIETIKYKCYMKIMTIMLNIILPTTSHICHQKWHLITSRHCFTYTIHSLVIPIGHVVLKLGPWVLKTDI